MLAEGVRTGVETERVLADGVGTVVRGPGTDGTVTAGTGTDGTVTEEVLGDGVLRDDVFTGGNPGSGADLSGGGEG